MNKQEYKLASRGFRLKLRMDKGKPTQLYSIVAADTKKVFRHIMGLKAARLARDTMAAGRSEISRSFGTAGAPLMLNKA